MSLHKLTAGDGYTYLIRQVAAADASVQGSPSLQEYYSAKGEAPGVWMGAGMASLGVSGEVTEQQMRNLFGEGRHPDAQRVEEENSPSWSASSPSWTSNTERTGSPGSGVARSAGGPDGRS